MRVVSKIFEESEKDGALRFYKKLDYNDGEGEEDVKNNL